MLIDLKKLFSMEETQRMVEGSFSMAQEEVSGCYPFVTPIAYRVQLKARSGAVSLSAEVSYHYRMNCDRCAEPVERERNHRFSHLLVRRLENEESDEYVEVGDALLDLDALLRTDVVLEIPSKFVCSEGCLGLCPTCGANLNRGPCGCRPAADPRWETLRSRIQ